MSTTEIELSFVEEAVRQVGRGPESLIPLLQKLQEHYHYLPPAALQRLCELTDISPASIQGVSTFYSQFRHKPAGRHSVCVCVGTACHVKGAPMVMDALHSELNLEDGEDTDAEGRFTLEPVACLGCCTLAPVVQVDETTYAHISPKTVRGMLRDFLSQNGQARPAAAPSGSGLPPQGEIRIGLDSCCVAQGTRKVHDAVARALAESGAPAEIKHVGCVAMCYQTPMVEIVPLEGPAGLYVQVQPDDALSLVLKHFRPPTLLRRLKYATQSWLDRLLMDQDEPPALRRAIDPRDNRICEFMGPQKHIALEACGQINPTDLDEYQRHGGLEGLRAALQMTPEEIVAQVQQSGLRGRGGAGFPTGIKWQRVLETEADEKFIICNADEGDPGAFMDRMLLESFPYRVLEGMIIAARAIGAHQGYLYIRAEYPVAVKRIRQALEACREQGLLGPRVLGSDYSLDLHIMEGAGAFVCGEETALLASMHGRRGMPNLRPPYPSERGLRGQPTLINNVETYAMAPWIFRYGAAAFTELGTPGSRGTKVFSLAGKVVRGGLIEVPMGITLRQVVDEVGGGVAPGRSLKAVQVGGPSGGCVPASLADTPIDYEALAEVGAIMGSGGLVVLDDTDCMIDIARYFLRFTQDQSCGKCTFCRIGTRRILEILDRLCEGRGRSGDLDRLEQLSQDVCAGSLCGLGATAPIPVLSTLRYFRDEYEAHLQGRCPAGRCQALVAYKINDRCNGCTLCAQQCPVDAIPRTPYRRHTIDLDKCTRCDGCRQICPESAVYVE